MLRHIIITLACFYSGLIYSQPPSNDDCVNAIFIDNLPFVDTVDATQATNNLGSIDLPGCGDMNDGVWFSFLGTGSTTHIGIQTDEFDVEIGVYTGSCDGLRCVKSIDESFSNGGEQGRIKTILGLKYFVNVGYWDESEGPEGNFTIEITSESSQNDFCGLNEMSNQFEAVELINNGTQSVAADFMVSANTSVFTLNSIKVNLLSNTEIDSLDIVFFNDFNGLPGDQYGEILRNMIPAEQPVIGQNLDFNFREVTINLNNPIRFTGNENREQRYWIQITAKNEDPLEPIGWETLSTGVTGLPLAKKQSDPGSLWQLTESEGVLQLIGDCLDLDGCATANSLQVQFEDKDSLLVTWNASNVSNIGFSVFVFEDETLQDTIIELQVDSTRNFTWISGLQTGTPYIIGLKTLCNQDDSSIIFINYMTRNTPANDNLCNANFLEVNGGCAEASFTNINATTEVSEPGANCYDGGANSTVWFSFVAPQNGTVTITTDLLPATLLDTEIALFASPGDCNDLSTLSQPIACDQDSGEDIDFNSILFLDSLTPEEIYFIQVSGFNGLTGNFCIEVQSNSECAAVGGLSIDQIGTDKVELSWNKVVSATGGFTLFGYEAGTDVMNESPLFQIETAVDESFATIENLVPGFAYEVYVTANCEDRGISILSDPLNFRMGPATPECGDLFYDSGGIDSTYQDNEKYGLLIESPGDHTLLSIDFSFVDIETGFDFLRIYDGSSAEAIELSNSEDGILEPGSYEASQMGGDLYLTFESDDQLNFEGWEATLSCMSVSIDDDMKKSEVKIFPNPVKDDITITARDQILKLELSNFNGELITTVEPFTKQYHMNIASLLPGVYLFEIHMEHSLEIAKFLKE
ncbi:T9SS type A sorting domain-containing protein [Portibacter marinus]|uniref:T9SS type A sorting domain-containing protein n=1 Tax=Portibacter marinus TaxID=2898660 RepID=UPI001F2C7356|nr:T9SS type A sorting domain-containing protein [Portibacter marinus]